MSTKTNILYVNKSNDQDSPSVLVFQKPTESNFAAHSTAWQVIDNIGYNCWHKFAYTLDTEVQVLWDNENSGTVRLSTKNGSNYSLKQTNGGISLEESGASGSVTEFDVTNKVSVKDGVSVVAYKDGNPILKKQVVAKGQKAEFVFHPRLFFGLSSEYEVGEIVDSAVMSEEFKEINLEGLQSVTITLTGNAADGFSFEVSDAVPL